MSKYYLMQFESDYCDEFGVEGFSVITLDQYKMYEFVVNNKDKYTEDIYIGFGSNEELYFENISEFLNCVTVKDISNNDARTLNGYFGGNYGLVYPIKDVEYFAEKLGYKRESLFKK